MWCWRCSSVSWVSALALPLSDLVWVLFLVLFIGMHLFGHGGHGGHGGRGGGGCGGGDEQRPADGAQPGKDKPQGHQH
ncbi:MAG: DUF2933 domain-containing protein [Gammaproteobacteria bacterium]|nr:DUF2933 domain-containing protein [Gammaproteobacteria bacterium]